MVTAYSEAKLSGAWLLAQNYTALAAHWPLGAIPAYYAEKAVENGYGDIALSEADGKSRWKR